MLFIIGFTFSILLTFCGSKFIRKYSVVCYILSATLSITATLLANFSRNLPIFFNQYILAFFTKSILATALWIIVMWTVALKNGSFLIKKLMPVRGELSVIAFILTLCHVIVYGQIYLIRLLFHTDTMQMSMIIMTVLSLFMTAIMLPLSVISFKIIRKKIQNKILLNTISSVIGAVAVCGVAFYIRPISQNTMEIRSEKTAIVSESVTEISSMKETFSVVNTQPSTQPTTASATATEIPTQKTSEKTTVASAQSSTQIPSQVSTQHLHK